MILSNVQYEIAKAMTGSFADKFIIINEINRLVKSEKSEACKLLDDLVYKHDAPFDVVFKTMKNEFKDIAKSIILIVHHFFAFICIIKIKLQ